MKGHQSPRCKGTAHFQNPKPRICARENAWDDPSSAPSNVSIVHVGSNVGTLRDYSRPTLSIELFATTMMMSIVEFNGK